MYGEVKEETLKLRKVRMENTNLVTIHYRLDAVKQCWVVNRCFVVILFSFYFLSIHFHRQRGDVDVAVLLVIMSQCTSHVRRRGDLMRQSRRVTSFRQASVTLRLARSVARLGGRERFHGLRDGAVRALVFVLTNTLLHVVQLQSNQSRTRRRSVTSVTHTQHRQNTFTIEGGRKMQLHTQLKRNAGHIIRFS